MFFESSYISDIQLSSKLLCDVIYIHTQKEFFSSIVNDYLSARLISAIVNVSRKLTDISRDLYISLDSFDKEEI